MQVQRVEVPGSRVESWTVLGDDGVPIGPVERYLAYLTAVERSPNTVKAYAHDLKDYFVFLDHRGLDWREVRLEDLGGYVAWLALPPAGRAGQVAVLPSAGPQVGAASVNRKLSALSAFYAHQVRHGVDVGELLITWQAGGRRNGGFKSFLHHVAKDKPHARRTIALKVPKKVPRVVTVAEMQAILDACEHLRDRFLFALLWDSGVRIGAALGLRHADIAAAGRTVTIVPRDNANGARCKSRQQHTIPVSAPLIRLWGDYLAAEYGELDSDYLDHYHLLDLRAPDRGRRPQGDGGCWLVQRHRQRGDPVTGSCEITQGERAWWQRRAAAELASILAAHPGLPCISWTVGPAGSVLAGQVNGLAPAAQVRAAFGAWQSALVLEDYREHQMSGGTMWLHAAARRHQVKVRLTATVFDDVETGQ